jgi:hypothetical protein
MNATFTNKEASFTQTPIPYPTLFTLGFVFTVSAMMSTAAAARGPPPYQHVG